MRSREPGLRVELEGDPSLLVEFAAWLPTEWIDALATLRDPEIRDRILEYLARGSNPHLTYGANVDRLVFDDYRRRWVID